MIIKSIVGWVFTAVPKTSSSDFPVEILHFPSLSRRLRQQAAGGKGVRRAVGLAHQNCSGLQQGVRHGGLACLGGAGKRRGNISTRRRMARERRRARYSLVSSIKDIVGESFIEDDADDQQKGDRNAMSDSKQKQTKIDTKFERPTETDSKETHTHTDTQRYRHRRTHTHSQRSHRCRGHLSNPKGDEVRDLNMLLRNASRPRQL